jgi:hypothetical protein
MDVTDATPNRIKVAMERFLEGHSVVFDRVAFFHGPDALLHVSVASQWLPENVTEQTARNDLNHAKQVMMHLAEMSGAFRERVASLAHRYSVVDDYGTGAVELCHLDGVRTNFLHESGAEAGVGWCLRGDATVAIWLTAWLH